MDGEIIDGHSSRGAGPMLVDEACEAAVCYIESSYNRRMLTDLRQNPFELALDNAVALTGVRL